MYENLMLFSVALYLLVSSGTPEVMIDCADELLVSFVRHFGQLYGRHEYMVDLWIMCQHFLLIFMSNKTNFAQGSITLTASSEKVI